MNDNAGTSGGALAPVHATLHGYPFVQPSRNPVTPTGRQSMRGSLYSLKNQGFVKHESELERKVFYLLEFAASVLQYSQQPPRMQLRVNGQSLRYTPDIAVKWRDGLPWLVEVKPLDLALLPAWQARFAAAALLSEAMGYRYVVVTNRQVDQPGMRDVIGWVDERRRQRTAHLGERPSQDACDPAMRVCLRARKRLDAVLSSQTRLRVREARAVLGGGLAGAAWLGALLSARHVVAPLSETLSDSTFIHAYTEADDADLFA